MEKKTITIFGATGNIGSGVIRLLSEAGITTIAVTRNLERAIQLPFITWMQADISDVQSLYATMKHSHSVFLLSGHSPDFVEEQTNVINAAKEVGVKYIVKLSSGVADSHSPFHIPRTHGIIEDNLIASGITYTLLRPTGIMQNWLRDMAVTIRKTRKFYDAAGDGRRPYIDRRDISEVVFRCLTEPEKHRNKTYLLTGSKAVNYYEVVNAISKAIQQQVEYVPISLQEARQRMEQKQMPFALIESLLSYIEAQRNGETETVSNDVETILGKPACTLEKFVNDHAAEFI